MNNISKYPYQITPQEREKLNGHKGLLVFFTGLSGAGKSTLANALEYKLHQDHIHTYVLDGDNVRSGINKNLGFSPEDRSENNRRIGEISKLFVEAGLVVLAAFVSPYEKDRAFIKHTVGKDNYIEVFVNTSLKVCEARDVKGLYKKARAGVITNMTGISAPYEAPKQPDLEVSEVHSVEEAIALVFAHVINRLAIH
ncbi:adenylyl-sulfate kinase [Gaetbulibacter saemankumensis]|uniref:adenylyl-sulfate kinase n=1 Tax=Gaetbulibacter saemankumensis TaxID=311208 RepID=UPI0004224AA9|nr:adenylyl-sulfate kinase [Gaetbulibacter saemankumensis]